MPKLKCAKLEVSAQNVCYSLFNLPLEYFKKVYCEQNLFWPYNVATFLLFYSFNHINLEWSE